MTDELFAKPLTRVGPRGILRVLRETTMAFRTEYTGYDLKKGNASLNCMTEEAKHREKTYQIQYEARRIVSGEEAADRWLKQQRFLDRGF
jgi:hypothetical protein